jgi:ribosome-associated protein
MAKATTGTKTAAKKTTATKPAATTAKASGAKATAAKKTAISATAPKKAAVTKTAAAKPAKALSNADLMKIAKAEAAKSAMPKVAEAKPAKGRAKKASAPVDPSIATKQNALAAAQFAIERKAENVRLLELKDVTSITDYFVVCSADTDRQVKAIAENVIVEMRDNLGQQPWRSEGWDTLRWVIIDFVDFVVHVLQSEAREFYNIERLWADAPSEIVEDTATRPKRATRKKVSSDDDGETAPAKRSKIRVIDDIDAE